jgi:predicted transcriptional regulator
MGEKPTGRLLVVAGLLLASLMAGFASADTTDVRLDATVVAYDEQTWYDANHPLIFTPVLVNEGETVSLTENPACPFVIDVYDQTNVLVVDGDAACPDRARGLDLPAGGSTTFEDVVWSMNDEDGEWLEGGSYTVELVHTSTGLSQSMSVTIQTPIAVPSDLAYDVNWVQRTGDADGAWLGLVSVHNPTSQAVDVDAEPSCLFQHTINDVSMLGGACYGDVETLMPGEMLVVDHVVVQASDVADVTVSTPGDGFVHQTTLDGTSASSTAEADLMLTSNINALQPFGQGNIFAAQLDMQNTLDEDQVLTFTSSCRAELWILDDEGRVVFDSRTGKECQSIQLETTLKTDAPLSLTLPQWNFFDSEGCRVQPGTYTVVTEVPQFGLATATTLEYRDAEPNACTPPANLNLQSSTAWLDDDTLQINTAVTNAGEAYNLRMIEPCAFVVEFIDASQQTAHRFQTLCGEYDGRKVMVPSGETALQFDGFNVEMLQDGQAIVPDGFYTLEITMLTSSTLSTTTSLAWPESFTEVEDNEAGTDEVVVESFELTGIWTGLLTEAGTCYVMESGESTYMLSNARTLGAWSPSSTVEGIYEVLLTAPSPACEAFNAPSVEVVAVVMEQSIEQEASPVPQTVLQDESEQVVEPTIVAPVVTVLVTVSLLSLLSVMVATNEGLRLPATVAGLWFFGLIGKTHETTDGRYQRGRLMGYLTANPGCHFRALMSALDMSNGQITHHLRVLEAEENVWRKSDGRLVRYYPLTNQLNPSTAEADLPVPPLSPDPNSLQGKILNLLDEDGGLGQFPTQAELAKRLEKSQQLISHHLRTLQKYGLVERRKMGVMNRYKLTREAIFLLETNDDFGQP